MTYRIRPLLSIDLLRLQGLLLQELLDKDGNDYLRNPMTELRAKGSRQAASLLLLNYLRLGFDRHGRGYRICAALNGLVRVLLLPSGGASIPDRCRKCGRNSTRN